MRLILNRRICVLLTMLVLLFAISTSAYGQSRELWNTTIHSYGEIIESNPFEDYIEIGVETAVDTLPKPPVPPTYTTFIRSYWPDWSGPFLRDVRADGEESYCWIIEVNPHGNVPPPTPRCATLSWEPVEFASQGTFMLLEGYSCSGTAVVPDMRVVTEYEVCGSDAPQYFTIKYTPGEPSPPVAVCTDVTVSADAYCQSEASIDNGSYDPEGQEITLTQIPAGPYPLGSTTVKLIVEDTDGLKDSCQSTVTVVDMTSPNIECPSDYTKSCDEPMLPDAPIVTDNCDPSPSVDYSDQVVPGDCPQEMTIHRTWTAVDAAGNSSACTQEITVVDTESPVLTCPPGTSVPINSYLDPECLGGYATALDNCDESPMVFYRDSFVVGGLRRIWTATDACGNSASCIQAIGQGAPVYLLECPPEALEFTIDSPDTICIPIPAIDAVTFVDVDGNALWYNDMLCFYAASSGTFDFTVTANSDCYDPYECHITVTVIIEPPFLCGDANGDGAIDIDDVIYCVNHVYMGGPEPIPWEAGDVNCDGKIDLLDIVALVNWIFRGGPEPCSAEACDN